MTQTWQLQEAKNKFSEVVEAAAAGNPQIITRRGTETAVLISYEEYQRLSAPATSLRDFFRSSPLVGITMDIERDTSPTRSEARL